MKRFLLLVSMLAAGVLRGGDIPKAVIPAGAGVNIHFVTGGEKDLGLIKAAGFKFIRMDFSWQATEPARGQYRWADYDELLGELERRGLRALYILDYSHSLYEQKVRSINPINQQPHDTIASPQRPESVAAFARWAAAAARHFRGRRVIWEIWNEPNIHFWSPKPDAKQYAFLAFATAKAIREADPEATIIAPASSGFPWEFFTTVFESGILEYLDGVSVHPYRNYRQGPETAAGDYRKLRELIDRFAPASRTNPIPILSGEWGYSTSSKGVSLETQAAFVVRQQLANLLHQVPLSIWYDWKNDGPDPGEREHNFGVVYGDLRPKPAWVAMRTMSRELDGFQIERRLKLPGADDYALLLARASGPERKLAVWTAGRPHEVRLAVSAPAPETFEVVACLGEKSQAHPVDGQLILVLGNRPQYITLGDARLSGP